MSVAGLVFVPIALSTSISGDIHAVGPDMDVYTCSDQHHARRIAQQNTGTEAKRQGKCNAITLAWSWPQKEALPPPPHTHIQLLQEIGACA